MSLAQREAQLRRELTGPFRAAGGVRSAGPVRRATAAQVRAAVSKDLSADQSPAPGGAVQAEWLTGPAGVIAADSDVLSNEPSGGYPSDAPLYGGVVGPGEPLTMTAIVYSVTQDCSPAFGPGACPNVDQQVQVTWQVTCNDPQGTGEGGSQTYDLDQVVTAPNYLTTQNAWLGYLPGVAVTFSFSVGAALCGPAASPPSPADPLGAPYDSNFTVQALATVDGVSSTYGIGALYAYEGVIPQAQLIACQCSPDSAGAQDPQAWRGDPVNTASGVFSDTVTDMTLESPGYPLAITRSYSSANTTSGPLGPGWSVPWQASLAVQPGGNVIFTAENGDQYDYAPGELGGFAAPPGATSVLAAVTGSSGTVTGYTLTTTGNDVLTFTASGQLQSITDSTGRGVTLGYTGSQVTSLTDAAGQSVSLSYNSAGLLTTIGLPDGNEIGYAYTGGLLTSATMPGGDTTSYGYNPAGLLATVQDPDGNDTVQNTYNPAGQVTAQQDGTGATTTYSYTTTSGGLQETNITDPDSGITTDVYAGGMLVESIDPLGNTSSYQYNNNYEPVAVTGPQGNQTSFTYDQNGNLTSLTDPLGNQQDWDYDSSDNLLSYTDAEFNTTTYTYNSMNEPTSVTSPAGGQTTYSYDSAGNLTSLTDPDGNTTTYTYNSSGQLSSVTNPDGDTTSYTYDPMGYPLTVTDPLGHMTAYAYDSDEQLVSVTAPGGAVTGYGYDGAGNLTTLTDPDNNAWTYSYTADNQLAQITSPLGSTTSYGYDGDGNQVTQTDADGVTTTTSYDADNRPVQVSYSDGTPTVSYSYNADSEVTSVTDATGTTALTYDADGNLLTDGGFSYGYNADGNVTSETYPDGTQVSYTYTFDGQIASATTGSSTTSYSYDPAGNLVTTSEPDGVTETRGYDGAGYLTSISDAASSGSTLDSYALTLNADGQPVQTAVTQDGTAQPTWYYGYDTAGRLASACVTGGAPSGCSAASAGTATGTAPNSSNPADPTNVTVTAGAGSATLTWTPPAEGTSALTGYTITSSGGQTATAGPYAGTATVTGLTAGTAYTFTITASYTAGTGTTTPTSPITPGNQISYSYDPAGNLTSSQTDGLTTTSSYNTGEELTQTSTGTSTTSYTYDADGQLSSDGTNTYNWNGAGELAQATTPAGTFSYGHDASGELATTSLNGTLLQGTTWNLNTPLPQAAEETSPSGATNADYTYGPAGLSSLTTPAGSYYPVSDTLGSITGLLNSAGTQVSATSYTPYGTPSQTNLVTGAPVSSIGYAGSYTLPGGTGLDDMQARDYNPSTGQFASLDPLTPVTGQPYLYASDDPIGLIDPTGAFSLKDFLITSAAIVGGAALAALCVEGGCLALATAVGLDALLSDTAADVVGSALIGAGTNDAVYGFTTPCRTSQGWAIAGATGAVSFGGGAAFGGAAIDAGEDTGQLWNSKLGTSGWAATGSAIFNMAAYLAGGPGTATATGLAAAGLVGTAGGYATNRLVLGLIRGLFG